MLNCLSLLLNGTAANASPTVLLKQHLQAHQQHRRHVVTSIRFCLPSFPFTCLLVFVAALCTQLYSDKLTSLPVKRVLTCLICSFLFLCICCLSFLFVPQHEHHSFLLIVVLLLLRLKDLIASVLFSAVYCCVVVCDCIIYYC